MLRSLTTVVLLAALAPLAAADDVRVTVTGEVEFNGINPAPLGNASPGDPATLTFLVDSTVFVDSPNFPTRGYAIDASSFELTLGSTTIGLASPLPQTTYFVIRNDDPAVDGFLVSSDIEVPTGVPLAQDGNFGPFNQDMYVTYGGSTLSSLDIEDAFGSYDFGGLTVFNWTVDDGPFQPLGLLFATLTIEAEVSTWSDQGCALAGVTGDPQLTGNGDLSSGSNNAVVLRFAAPNALTGLFLGLASGAVPFKGGTLKPFPFFDPVVLTTNGLGQLGVPFVMPAGAPAGTELWLQCAIQDAAAPVGLSLSNALLGISP